MKTTPYELVFGQPPRQNVFPGVVKSEIMEEDIEDILKEEEEKVKDENQNQVKDNSQDENQDSDDENQDENPNKSGDENQDDENQDENPNKSGDENQDDENQDENPDKSRDENQDSDDENQDENLNRDRSQKNQDKSIDGEKRGSSQDITRDKSDFLASTEKHRQLREAADKQYRLNAERMKLKYCKTKRKKVLDFSEGDFVSVRIPRIDRTSTDFHRLPCVVVECLGSKFHLYRLRYCIKYIHYCSL